MPIPENAHGSPVSLSFVRKFQSSSTNRQSVFALAARGGVQQNKNRIFTTAERPGGVLVDAWKAWPVGRLLRPAALTQRRKRRFT
jgi:hypothetical protein